jgi:hypothetical protein
MFICDCGREYKYSSGLNKHKEKCSFFKSIELPISTMNSKAVVGGAGADDDDITKSTFFTFPLTQLKPTANFSKEDLEMLEKRKQARLKAIQQAQIEEKQRAAAVAAEKQKREMIIANGIKYTHIGSYDDKGNKQDTQVHENIGNEEHNAAFNIKYVRSSSQNKHVIDAVAAAANEYCSGHGIGCGGGNFGKRCMSLDNRDDDDDGRDDDSSGSDVVGGGGAASSNLSNGTTVYTHPTRTISIVENDGDDMDESERIVTLEKMTYLVLALIQQNTKLQKENAIMKSIISKIDPSKLE